MKMDVITPASARPVVSPETSPDGAPAPAVDRAYVQGMERLLQAVQDLSLARDLATIQQIVRIAAREMTGADGATFVLSEGDNCYYADENAIEPLWKGKRFPQDICLSGWVMRNRQSTVIPDIALDPRIPQEAYRPTFVRSMVMVPIRTIAPVGAIGNYWATTRQPTDDEVRLLQGLADATSVAMENVQVYAELESRVRSRTQELTVAHAEIQKRAITDEMTGLLNRRGFYEAAQVALHSKVPLLLAYIDADGLKDVNDTFGHAAGDAMLIDIADTLRACFRATDIIARLGGDEFCVLLVNPRVAGRELQAMLRDRIDHFNSATQNDYNLSLSFGCIEADKGSMEDLDRLLIEADRRMYEAKISRNVQRL